MMLEQAEESHTLTVMSIQAMNQDAFAQDVTAYLGIQLGITVVFPHTIPWQ
jgi:hypothetical protein